MCPRYWHAHPSHPGWLHPSSRLSIWQDEKHQPQNDSTTSMMFYHKNLKKFPWDDHWEPPQTEHVTAPAGSLAPQKKLVSLKLRAVQSWEHFLILTARLVSAGLKQFTGQITKRKINAAIQHNSVFIPTGVSSSDGQCSVALARYRYTVWPHCSLPACIINEVKMPKGRKDTARLHDFVSVKRSCCKCRQRHLAKT